jgi:hypothetical protein
MSKFCTAGVKFAIPDQKALKNALKRHCRI